jgi:hypothetical protein
MTQQDPTAPPGPPGPTGLGMGNCMSGEVEYWLRMGYPRLALARALGTVFQPYVFNVRATFDTSDVDVVADQGADAKITTDTVIDAMIVRVTDDNVPENVFSPQSAYFTNYQSGIEATLEVLGAPRYSVAPNFTPLSTLAEMINPARWPCGWVLTYQQQVKMTFFARNPLAHFPTTVVCTFRGFTPTGERFAAMPNAQAIAELRAMGAQIPDYYKSREY